MNSFCLVILLQIFVNNVLNKIPGIAIAHNLASSSIDAGNSINIPVTYFNTLSEKTQGEKLSLPTFFRPYFSYLNISHNKIISLQHIISPQTKLSPLIPAI